MSPITSRSTTIDINFLKTIKWFSKYPPILCSNQMKIANIFVRCWIFILYSESSYYFHIQFFVCLNNFLSWIMGINVTNVTLYMWFSGELHFIRIVFSIHKCNWKSRLLIYCSIWKLNRYFFLIYGGPLLKNAIMHL